MKELLTQVEIDRNIQWLCDNGSAPVRYLTHRYVLAASPRSERLQQLWSQVLGCAEVRDVFSKQNPDGSWYAGGEWAQSPSYMPKDGYSAFTPKYVTAVWVLSVLGDMGFTIQDPRVRKAYDYAMSYRLSNGLFSRFKVPRRTQHDQQNDHPENAPCDLSVFLLGLSKVCDGHITPLKKSFAWLLEWQREDSGWVLERHKQKHNWTRSCPWVSHHAVSALYHTRHSTYSDALRRGLEFQAWYLGTKTDDQLRHFFYRGHNVLPELVMFSETGVGLNSRPVEVILEWLYGMYNPAEGCFRYRGKPIPKFTQRRDGATPRVAKYRLYHIIEDDWLTLHMTRIAKNLSSRSAPQSHASDARPRPGEV